MVAVLAFQASTVRFNSPIFPYSVQQPSAYRHVVLIQDQKVDYFFPDLGSFTTNVSIYAEPGHVASGDADYLRAVGGQHVRLDGYAMILGKKMAFTRADFAAIAGRWVEERLSFLAQGLLWHLTVSYDVKYHSMRPVMLHLLESFRLRPVGSHRG
jgi:hypothetical protein